MSNMELKVWKEELQIQKDQNTVKIKKLTQKLNRLNEKVNFAATVKEQLDSSLLTEMNEEIKNLSEDIENIKKENRDIGIIIYSIDVELGNIFVCN
ncbi:MAG TPA: hypothetical protein GX497_12490 [Bacillus bacterium]|nr:hypothetical protein [Bacillus sp. (in: firmicutes)]